MLQWLLISLDQGTSPLLSPQQAWPTFCSNEPSTPDDCITTYDTAGRDDGRIMVTGNRVEHPGVQVRVRSTDHPTGYAKARAICVVLDSGFYDQLVTLPNGNQYVVHAVYRSGNVIALGKDTPNSKRTLFTINATMDLLLVI